jgi:hypothetical protein
MSKKSVAIEEKNNAIESLRKILPENTTVYTIVTKVSSSGMSRRIKLYIVDSERENPRIRQITYLVSKAIGWPANDLGILVSGCGMDMGFHTVYTLGSIINRNGYHLHHEWM